MFQDKVKLGFILSFKEFEKIKKILIEKPKNVLQFSSKENDNEKNSKIHEWKPII